MAVRITTNILLKPSNPTSIVLGLSGHRRAARSALFANVELLAHFILFVTLVGLAICQKANCGPGDVKKSGW